MFQKDKLLSRIIKRYEKKQNSVADEKDESYYFRDPEQPKVKKEDSQTEDYEILEREIVPKKIICPDCGGLTLEGLEFCDKCGGELY